MVKLCNFQVTIFSLGTIFSIFLKNLVILQHFSDSYVNYIYALYKVLAYVGKKQQLNMYVSFPCYFFVVLILLHFYDSYVNFFPQNTKIITHKMSCTSGLLCISYYF